MDLSLPVARLHDLHIDIKISSQVLDRLPEKTMYEGSFLFLSSGEKSTGSHMLGKCPATELQPQPTKESVSKT